MIWFAIYFLGIAAICIIGVTTLRNKKRPRSIADDIPQSRPLAEITPRDKVRAKTTAVATIPRRYSISTLMLVTAMFAIMFALLRWLGAPVAVHVFLLVQMSFVAILQMCYPNAPRLASMVAGAVICTLLFGTLTLLNRSDHLFPAEALLCTLVASTMFGAFFGYICGILGAGVFLLAAGLSRWIPGLTVDTDSVEQTVDRHDASDGAEPKAGEQ